MRRALALAALAAALTACSTTPTTTAAAGSPAPAASTAAASPSPTADPACTSKEMGRFFREIDAYSRRGAFNGEGKVRLNYARVVGWKLALSTVQDAGGPKVAEAAKQAGEEVDTWIGEDPAGPGAVIEAMAIQVAAKELALECGLWDKYAFTTAV